MSIVNVVLLLFGLGTCARGAYALITQDVTDENERMIGQAAARHGVMLVAIGAGLASHAIFEWPWITALVNWLRQME